MFRLQLQCRIPILSRRVTLNCAKQSLQTFNKGLLLNRTFALTRKQPMSSNAKNALLLSTKRLRTLLPIQRSILSITKTRLFRSEEKDDQPTEKTQELKENIYTIPNVLTFSRLVAAPCIGYLILNHNYDSALGLFALAGFTDLLDGYIARKYNMKTLLGTIIDPFADKVLMTILTVTLTMEGTLPMPLSAIILGRDAGLILSAFYYRYVSLPEPKTLSRYINCTIPSAEVRPTQISKINTALQLALMGLSLTTLSVGFPPSEFMTGLQWVVGGTTIWSGASYVFSKDAVQILKR
ncbi:CDP-alcohol phosphatidyltransferase-domain-containing protein [Mycotypha africana]|uniref:CDP-alcohol phosphatidyltransferase-domain-containing protein n=1 Tax=Mycotypha africana TaxID=64632 RepID=UPI002300DBDC|nr:CDP-alcohol phosphatidyltransferase-domain-containing protein [Mycotypha africana]KAI8987823.1 CDP-alcohol phosphatidyltransferase-domain-containing protein [Mycotypha africana]